MGLAGAERHRRAGRDHDPGESAIDERGRESINFFGELERRNVFKGGGGGPHTGRDEALEMI